MVIFLFLFSDYLSTVLRKIYFKKEKRLVSFLLVGSHVTEEKAYGFVWYHAYCKKYATKHWTLTTDTTVHQFGCADYDYVVVLIGTFDHETNTWNYFGDALDFDASTNIFVL